MKPFARSDDDAEQLRAVVETIKDGVLTIDRHGIVQSMNPAAKILFGYSVAEVVGKNVNMLMPEPFHGEHHQYLKNYLTTGHAKILGVGREVMGKRKDGSVFPMDLAVGEMRVGNERMFVGSCRDITERKEAENHLIERSAQLEAANKELDSFAYSVSHDLRAPLRAMDGFSRALVEDYGDKLEGDAKHYLGRISAAGQRMGKMIDDILLLSRTTRGNMEFTATDLSAIARDIIEQLREAEPERQVSVDIKPGIHRRCDPRLIQIVLDNLLGNAWKFTGKTEDPEIEFSSKMQNGETICVIRDNGAGFDMAYADKLFGMYQRLHAHEEFEGTGIGLATVSRLVHRHGGRIWAESIPDKGACFFFTLGSDAK